MISKAAFKVSMQGLGRCCARTNGREAQEVTFAKLPQQPNTDTLQRRVKSGRW